MVDPAIRAEAAQLVLEGASPEEAARARGLSVTTVLRAVAAAVRGSKQPRKAKRHALDASRRTG